MKPCHSTKVIDLCSDEEDDPRGSQAFSNNLNKPNTSRNDKTNDSHPKNHSKILHIDNPLKVLFAERGRTMTFYMHKKSSSLKNCILVWGGVILPNIDNAQIIILDRDEDEDEDENQSYGHLYPRTDGERSLFRNINKWQMILSSRWITDSVRDGYLQDESRYRIQAYCTDDKKIQSGLSDNGNKVLRQSCDNNDTPIVRHTPPATPALSNVSRINIHQTKNSINDREKPAFKGVKRKASAKDNSNNDMEDVDDFLNDASGEEELDPNDDLESESESELSNIDDDDNEEGDGDGDEDEDDLESLYGEGYKQVEVDSGSEYEGPGKRNLTCFRNSTSSAPLSQKNKKIKLYNNRHNGQQSFRGFNNEDLIVFLADQIYHNWDKNNCALNRFLNDLRKEFPERSWSCVHYRNKVEINRRLKEIGSRKQ